MVSLCFADEKSRQFTVKEFCSPLMAPVIARKLARIHQLQMPLPQPAEDFMYRQMQALNKAVQANHELQQIPAEVFERYRTKIEKLRSFDFGSLIERLRRYQSTFKSRLVFTHNDLNRTNILMLDHPLNGKSDETPDPDSVAERVLIIDFEYCSYGFRWADISTYFQEIAFERWELQPINDPFSSYPEKTIRRDFFDHYLDEWSRTKVLESIDTPYQLELECKFGALCVNLIRVLWAMAHPKINDEKHAFWVRYS